MRRIALFLLILALVPAIYVRQHLPPPSPYRPVIYHDLLPGLRAAGHDPRYGALTLTGAWQLTSANPDFGNFSALAVRSSGDLLAVSDRNAVMVFSRPDRPGPWHTWQRDTIRQAWRGQEIDTDSESVSVDPRSGNVLIGYEGTPRFHLFSADFTHDRKIAAPVLMEWPNNQGPESLRQLADGRTVAIGEVYAHWWSRRRHTGLIWPGLPRPNQAPARFELIMPEGYRPVELAQAPDGRLLVLGRKFTLGGFRTVVTLVADPRAIRPGAQVEAQPIAWIDDPRIRDNYEGMVATPEADGSTAIWLISDSNQMVWLQRTLLLKLKLS
ncbi:esterase-like activity of phytase family protein [Novosphingobium sp. SG720]|uniref:esterase-like activity of phytase family protein n=1 Tax=Novosphingobium sp. SG720 TaxID=2586998 RepID=UPI00144885CA|nr:esterase-like activity of phytase family protein [Novosphingobium sp. SG720]NKJ42727.1 hypothetical protein [Novosphingobium sp. SG720]